MQRLTVEDIIHKIEAEKTFHAVTSDYSFTLKIDAYVPYVCAAIHNGHQFRRELWKNCLLTEYQRWYEEDPETKTMIETQPIVLSGNDSRFEYDLNRNPEEAIFETVWGKQLWRTPLQEEMRVKSLQKHDNFYKIVKALICKIETKFGVAIVYDLHSYNWKRWNREGPTFNLGTLNVDNKRFKKDIESWRQSLSQIQFPHNIKSSALINDTFTGNGYFLKFITETFQNTLVLATEIAKVYCDEYSYIIFPEVVNTVEKQLRNKIKEHALNFYNTHKK